VPRMFDDTGSVSVPGMGESLETVLRIYLACLMMQVLS